MLTGTPAVSTGGNTRLVTDLIDSSVTYFIDPQGGERFLASPMGPYRWRILLPSRWPALGRGAGPRAGRTPARPLAAARPGPGPGRAGLRAAGRVAMLPSCPVGSSRDTGI